MNIFDFPYSEQYLELCSMVEKVQSIISFPQFQYACETTVRLHEIFSQNNGALYKVQETLSQLSTTIFPLVEHQNFIIQVEKAGWPLFMVNDEELERQILFHLDDDKEDLTQLISELYDSDYWEKRLEKWTNNPTINKARIPVLREAIQAHNAGMYYSAVTICVCQICGLIEDINKEINLLGLSLNKDQHQITRNLFRVEEDTYNKIKRKEKGYLMQSFVYCKGGLIIWRHFITYLNNNILSSSKDESLWKEQPLRNKICHGEQLNYGTLEHSLKVLICIDCLMRYANNVMLGLQDDDILEE